VAEAGAIAALGCGQRACRWLVLGWPNTVALVTGVLNGLVSAVGCIIGRWMVDRFGRWWVYFGFGAALAFVAIGFAVIARTPSTYVLAVLVYAFATGGGYATYSGLVVDAIVRGVASTKYAICQSIGNVPVSYMTAVDGLVHDHYGTAAMLTSEAVAGLLFIGVANIALRVIQRGEVN